MFQFISLSDVVESTNQQTAEENDALRSLPKALVAPPSSAGNKIVGLVEELMPQLGYECHTRALPDKDKGKDPFAARDLARGSSDYWKADFLSSLPEDVAAAMVVTSLGGTGDIALGMTKLPEAVTHQPVVKTVLSSDRMRGTPSPAEARNTVISYELMAHKRRRAGYGHVLLSNMFERYGYTEYLDKVALLQAVLPHFDQADLMGSFVTGAATEISIGNTVDDLRDALRSEAQHLFDNPWWVTSDWDWVAPPEEPPLAGPEASIAYVLLPFRFEDAHTDVDPDGAPCLRNQVFAPVDNAYLVVLRPINRDFVDAMRENTKQWLFDELEDSDSDYGDEIARVAELRAPKADPAEKYQDLLDAVTTTE